jgi:hypothetical protein
VNNSESYLEEHRFTSETAGIVIQTTQLAEARTYFMRASQIQSRKSARCSEIPILTSMTKTSTKTRPNRKPAAAALAAVAATKKRLSHGNASKGKLRKKTRKNVSHQQSIQARDTLDAEYRDWRTAVSKRPLLSFPTTTKLLCCLLVVCL